MKKNFILIIILLGVCNCQAQVMFQKWIGNDYLDNPRSVTMCSDSTYLIGGTSDVGGYHVFMTKINMQGDTLWTRIYSGTSIELVAKCAPTNDGGYFIAGNCTNQGEFHLAKTDSVGTVLWSYQYGSTAEESCWTAIETSDNGFMLVGRTGTINRNILAIKTDSTGTIEWAKIIDETTSDEASCVQQTNDGGYVISGFSSGSPTINMYLIKLNGTGTLEWFKTYDLTNDYNRSVYLTSDGGFILAGLSYGSDGNILLIKTDSLGQVMWAKSYDTGTTDYGFDVIQTSDGGYAVVGTSHYIAGNTTTILLRVDSIGNLMWSKIYTQGNNHYDNFPKLLESWDHGFIITCQSTFSTSTGYPEWYIIKTDSLGNSGCLETTVSPTAQVVTPVEIAATPVISIPVLNTVSYGLTRSAGASVLTHCLNTGFEDQIADRNELEVFPNPSKSTLSISGIDEKIREISVFNNLGIRVLHVASGSFHDFATINITNLNQGLYFLNIATENKVRSAKFVKE